MLWWTFPASHTDRHDPRRFSSRRRRNHHHPHRLHPVEHQKGLDVVRPVPRARWRAPSVPWAGSHPSARKASTRTSVPRRKTPPAQPLWVCRGPRGFGGRGNNPRAGPKRFALKLHAVAGERLGLTLSHAVSHSRASQSYPRSNEGLGQRHFPGRVPVVPRWCLSPAPGPAISPPIMKGAHSRGLEQLQPNMEIGHSAAPARAQTARGRAPAAAARDPGLQVLQRVTHRAPDTQEHRTSAPDAVARQRTGFQPRPGRGRAGVQANRPCNCSHLGLEPALRRHRHRYRIRYRTR